MTDFYRSADVAARECLERLLCSFPSRPERFLASSTYVPTGYPLIGIEVEVKWGAFYPDLYKRFLAPDKTYFDLSDDEQRLLSFHTCTLEHAVIERLQLGTVCGLARGKDRYWEHVLPPTTEWKVAHDILQVMNANGLLPAGKHALHLTVGDVKVTRDLYFALLALELVSSDEARILSAFHKTDHMVSTGWAKKGLAGIFNKVDWDLKHDSQAAELRTVYLDTGLTAQVLRVAANACRGVADLQRGEPETKFAQAFIAFRDMASAVLAAYGLPDENWRKPHDNPEIWRKFARSLTSIHGRVLAELVEIYALTGDDDGGIKG